MLKKLKIWAKKLKRQIFTLYFAYKHERVQLYAKVFIACVVAYAFSPIDLIPDFIPILGYLDDVILVPLGIIISLKLIPENVKIECEIKAEEMMKKGIPKNWIVGSFILLVWVVIFIWAILKVYQLYS
ncbi:YkvA family protein [Gottfriedia acidiceleris]|uniref:YkvA family protein n=1 Tax=Gottfriedia acidiceleris TaxID=371036 RepID=UPI000B44E5C3|nr:YkvA family protein [Gottfriedia acidiceleris]